MLCVTIDIDNFPFGIELVVSDNFPFYIVLVVNVISTMSLVLLLNFIQGVTNCRVPLQSCPTLCPSAIEAKVTQWQV